jgi:heme A synthase
MTKNTIIYLVYFVLAGAAVWSVWRFKRLRPEFRTLAIFLFLSAFIQGLSEIIAVYKANNLFLSHAYTVLSFLILVRFYQHLLKPFFFKIPVCRNIYWLCVAGCVQHAAVATFKHV